MLNMLDYLRNSEYAKIKKLIESDENYILDLKKINNESDYWDYK